MAEKYDIFTLPNGIRLVVWQIKSLVSYFGAIVSTGSRDESPERQGLAHFVEHTIFKGTGKRKAWQISSRMESIGGELAQYSCVYLVQTQGLNAEKTSALRRACFGAEVKMLCVKNTLLKKALEASETDYSELYDLLHGETTLLLSNTGNAPAKLIKKFRDKKETLPLLKGAYVEETVYVGEENLETLSNIKSKNELIADVVALLQSPAKNVISALQSGGNLLHGVLETLSKKEA